MNEWFDQAGNKAKLVISVLGVIGILLGWFSWVDGVADNAKQALEKAAKNESVIENVNERLNSIETTIKVSENQQLLRDKYTTQQLNEIKDLIKSKD